MNAATDSSPTVSDMCTVLGREDTSHKFIEGFIALARDTNLATRTSIRVVCGPGGTVAYEDLDRLSYYYQNYQLLLL